MCSSKFALQIRFEDTAEGELRVLVALSAMDVSELKHGRPVSFALTAAHTEGFRCVLVSNDVPGATERARRTFPEGCLLALCGADLATLATGRPGTRVTPAADASVPFKLVVARMRTLGASPTLSPAALLASMSGATVATPGPRLGHRAPPVSTAVPAPVVAPPRRLRGNSVRAVFVLSVAALSLVSLGYANEAIFTLALVAAAASGWLAWDRWLRGRTLGRRPGVAKSSPKRVLPSRG